MAFGFVSDTQSSGTGTSLAITVPAVKVGQLVVITMKFAGSISGIAVTDNASVPNSYAQAVAPVAQGSNRIAQWYGVATTGGATVITVSWTGSVSNRITVDVFSGGNRTNATVFDKSASNTGSSATTASLSIAPANAGQLIVAGIIFSGTPTGLAKGTNYLFSNSSTSLASEYRQVGTTAETAPFSWTGSNSWAEVASAYIPAPVTTDFFKLL